MPFYAQGREKFLSADEIVTEALRQFDEGTDVAPSIRHLAAGLGVSASAIYHYFPSRTAIVEQVVDRVWAEATELLLAILPDPFSAPPTDVLVVGALVTRRAFRAHHRVVPYMPATPRVEGQMDWIALLASDVFRRLGFTPAEARDCFHAYCSFVLGSTTFEGTRRIADQQFAASAGAGEARPAPSEDRAATASDNPLFDAVVRVMDLSRTDPDLDEALFVRGVERLVASFVTEHVAAQVRQRRLPGVRPLNGGRLEEGPDVIGH